MANNYLQLIREVSSISHFRSGHGPHGPPGRALPRPRWLQRLRLPLGHAVHHLCAPSPLPASLGHALPAPLPLLTLSENHIGQGSAEELHLITSATPRSPEVVVVSSRHVLAATNSCLKICITTVQVQGETKGKYTHLTEFSHLSLV